MMELELIEQYVILAIRDLLKNDRILLTNKVHERSISHKLGRYFENYFKEYDIDCEYDLNAEAIKDKKLIYEIEYKLGKIIRNPKQIIPDIIVHERGNNCRNLLIVEMKKSCTKKSDKDSDENKLKATTTKVLSNFGYSFGLFIEIGIEDKTGEYALTWYNNGDKIKKTTSSNA